MSNFIPYLTWHITDPIYWNYIRVPGIVFPVKSIFELRSRNLSLFNSLLSKGFKKQFKYDGSLFVDSLMSSINNYQEIYFNDYKQVQTLYLQYVLGADILIQRDIPILNIVDENLRKKLYLKNMSLAELAIKFGEKLGVEVMVVIHGWNLESYLECAAKYSEMGIKYIGIGSLLGKKNNRSEIIKIVRKVRELVGKNAYIHVFGITGFNVMKSISKYINSADSSSPIKAAINRELYIIENRRLKRIKIINPFLLKIMINRCDSTASALALKVLESNNINRLKKNLALFNAYMFVSYYTGYNPCSDTLIGDEDAGSK